MRCDCPLSAFLWKMFVFYRLWKRNTDRRRCCTRTNNCIGTIYGTATKSLSTASWIVLYRRRRPRLPYVHEEGSQANHRTIRNIPDSCWDPADLQWKVNEISRFRSRINLYVERLGIFLHITHTHTPNNCSRKKYINLSILQGWERVDNDTIERRVCAWIMAARESLKLKIFTILGRIGTCF